MKILIDIGHPAHVHLFKNLTWILEKKGHEVFFTVREKEVTLELMKKYGFKFKSLGKHFKSTPGKIFGLIKFDYKIYNVARIFRPDVFLSHGSIYAAQVAWILGKPHIALEDTFNIEQIVLYKPFTSVILSSDYCHPYLGEKNIRYSGFHELAYLHKKYFEPDQGIRKQIGLKPDQKLVLLRFVSLEASHDMGHKGISRLNKIRVFREYTKESKVLISSEKELPPELEPYRLSVPPDKIHDVLAASDLLFSESATMTAEAAVLGIPAVYVDRKGRVYTKELEEKYNLVFNYSDTECDQLKAIDKGIEILTQAGIKEIWQKKRLLMLRDKINLTDFLVWFVENYPESARIMKENPGYHKIFK
jgi:uncharacterized protein